MTIKQQRQKTEFQKTGIHAVLSKSSLTAWRIIASSSVQNAPSEDSNQTRNLRWVHISHYENTPIQIYSKFHLQKLIIFR